MAGDVEEITEAEFDAKVLKSEIPVLVDFWAPWCGPCKAVIPVLNDLARDYSGRVKFTKVNVDNAQTLAAKYNVSSIPNMVIFNKGATTERYVGNAEKEDLSVLIDKVLAK